jgi:outer membrane biosynthesis protein TonB
VNTLDALRAATFSISIGEHLGVDTEGAKQILESAHSTLLENDFETAIDLSKQGLEIILASKQETAEARIQNAESAVQNADAGGVPVQQSKDLIRHAKALSEAGDYLRAFSYAEMAENMATVRSQRHGEVSESIEGTKEKAQYARDLGMDMSRIDELIGRLDALVAQGKFQKVEEMSIEIEGEIYTSLIKMSQDSINKVAKRIQELEAVGGSTSEAKDLLKGARSSLEEEDFAAVKEKVIQCNEILDGSLRSEAEERFSYLKGDYDHGVTAGVTVQEVADAIKEIEGHIGMSEFGTALEKIKTSRELLKNEKLKALNTMLKKCTKLVASGEKYKLDMSSTRSFLDEADHAKEREEVEEAFDFAVQAMNEVKSLHKDFIESILETVRETIELASSADIKIDKVTNLLTKTEDLVNKEIFDRAIFYAKQCSREADRLKFKIISSQVSMLEQEMRADDLDYAAAKVILEKARSALLTKKYEESKQYLKECKNEINRIRNLPPEEEYIGEPEAPPEEPEAPPEEPEAPPEEPEAPPEEPEAPPEEPVEVADQELEIQAASEIAEVQEFIGDLEAKNLDMTEAHNHLHVAMECIGEDKFREAIDNAHKAKKVAEQIASGAPPEEKTPPEEAPPEKPPEEVPPEKPPEEVPPEKPPEEAPPEKPPAPETAGLENEIMDVESRIERAKKLDIDLSIVENLLAQTKEANVANKENTKQLLHQTNEALKTTLRKYKESKDIFLQTQKIIDTAKRYNLNTTQAQGMLDNAAQIKGTDAKAATSMANQAKTTILKQLEGVYPYLSVDLAVDKPFMPDQWNDTFLYLSNTGNTAAEDIKVKVLGAQVEKEIMIPKVQIGETKETPIKLMPAGTGQQTLKISITFQRDFDGRTYIAEFPKQINVAQTQMQQVGSEPGGPPPINIKELPPARCNVCTGTIPQGVPRIKCDCGWNFHETCASKIMSCPNCNKPIQNLNQQ